MSALCHHGPWLPNINMGFIRDFTNGYNNCDYYRNGGGVCGWLRIGISVVVVVVVVSIRLELLITLELTLTQGNPKSPQHRETQHRSNKEHKPKSSWFRETREEWCTREYEKMSRKDRLKYRRRKVQNGVKGIKRVKITDMNTFMYR